MICIRCKLDKPIEDYYNYDRYKCRECRKELDRKRYPKRKKYLRDYWIKWYSKPKNQKSHSQNSRKFAIKWNTEHPRKVWAHGKLGYALLKGVLIKPNKCSKCDKLKKIEAHHPNYNKPYDVIWLCRSCHRLLHLDELEMEDSIS